ncbi:hypothetical protein BDY19DRAFT_537951 [Irpex rosettiformis]|uniref:Uncharacterized protein n=1 Tax=Irpex rosettiformis TaxID=378272 RepID=A0ACB8TR01_9APHY|nr:hypothetical protein BDY19DRAFT_537951 [Irpex rosettiformis]
MSIPLCCQVVNSLFFLAIFPHFCGLLLSNLLVKSNGLSFRYPERVGDASNTKCLYLPVHYLVRITGDYVATAFNVLYIFECFLTFSGEVDVIWGHQWTMMTWLYASTRHTGLLLAIIGFIPPWNNNVCFAFTFILEGLQLTGYLCLALFSAVRAYALLNGRKLIAGVIFLLNLVPFAINMHNAIL